MEGAILFTFFLGFLISILLLYLTTATFYLLALAVSYFVIKERMPGPSQPVNCFAIIVPAHNEELLIGNLCQSLTQIEYPKDRFVIHIVADNCNDRTADICRQYPVRILERHDPDNAGKGQALSWSLQQFDLDAFDAVLIVDADNYVDAQILCELNQLINNGEVAIQCYNAVGNRDDSWFTELLFVSRTIGNELYHEAKYRLGLSSYLMGNGLCFQAALLKQKGWTAFSAGEDWEYYAQLIEDGIKIGFAAKAKVFHQESRSLNQATSQRLRWSSGRFKIARTLGLRLLAKGVKERAWQVADASLPLIFPNYSLQINLTVLGLGLAIFLPAGELKSIFFVAFVVLLGCQGLLFVSGSLIAGSPLKTFKAALFVPFFLMWKAVIDVLCISGLYRGNKWTRTRRH